MELPTDTRVPSCTALRTLGWCMAGATALGGHLLAPSRTSLLLELVGAAIFAISTIRPSALRPLQFLLVPLLRICPGGSRLLVKDSSLKPTVPPSRRRQAA
jgi:hypothetical protein